MPTASILFCDRCGSEKVDVAGFKGTTEREFKIRCYACGHESAVKGFTLGRGEAPEQTLREARSGRAGQQTTKLPQVKL
jgi:hypothetical protein